MKKQPFFLIILTLLGFLAACTSQGRPGSLTTWPEASASPVALVETASPFPSATSQSLPLATQETEAVSSAGQAEPTPVEPSLPPPTSTSEAVANPLTRVAVIGDFGSGEQAERDVAELVAGWQPDFVLTVGDNNYPDGAADTIDQNIGQFYQQYIQPYQGQFGPGADVPRFFPTMGNHDWNTDRGQPYLDYFSLPGNERYYDFTWGALHIFAVSSDSREPDGVSRKSIQATWLKERLASSSAPWKLVVMHHPPYSSGTHGSVDWMRWPFQEWGASAVLAGHDHTYERLIIDGFPYFINGLGGGEIYYFTDPLPGSEARYSEDYGAMLISASPTKLLFEFYNRSGELIDAYEQQK